MSIVLSQARYGKSEIRLVKVSRRPDVHDLCDITVDVGLEGDFDAAYVDGDNAGLLATDTMRNAVYALAKERPIDDIESFGRRLVEHFLASGPSVTRARVHIVELDHRHAVTDSYWTANSLSAASSISMPRPGPVGIMTSPSTSGKRSATRR